MRCFNILRPYRDQADTDAFDTTDIEDLTVDSEDLGTYEHWPNSNPSYTCYEYFQNNQANDLGQDIRVPRDTSDPILYFMAGVDAAAEADRKTVASPACGAGWSPSAPPNGLVYREGTQNITKCYYIYKRDSEIDPWVEHGGPWDRWTGASTYEYAILNQTRGEVWAKTSTTQIEVWPIETQYSAATPTTITIPAGTINWFVAWGQITFVGASNGNIYVYDGTSYFGPVPSPLDTATWTWAEISFGWCVITDPSAVHFFKITSSGVEFYQSVDGSLSDAGSWSAVGCVSEDTAVSGMWRRLSLDHSTGEWGYRGNMPHIHDRYDDGWSWYGNLAGNVLIWKQIDSRYYYRYCRVV